MVLIGSAGALGSTVIGRLIESVFLVSVSITAKLRLLLMEARCVLTIFSVIILVLRLLLFVLGVGMVVGEVMTGL